MTPFTGSLSSGFVASAEQFAERPALEAGGETLTYGELLHRSAAIAAALQRAAPSTEPSLVGVLAHRTPCQFAGVLGTHLAGCAYVPLNTTFPPQRTRLMLERSGARALVADAAGAEQLPEVLSGIAPGMLLIAPDHPDPAGLAARLPGHRLLGAGELPDPAAWAAPDVDPQELAYVMFTSGSTGTPKGVMVSHANARHYIARMVERYELTEHDRCSQMFEPTFDPSVFDMFCAWQVGACVCCPDRRTLLKPGRWIREAGLTLWFSAPSLGILMQRLGQLKPGSLPALRWSLFAGEALPVELARSWQQAAPNSTVENLYGPTEVTVVCVLHRFDPAAASAGEQGMVPIGRPLPGLSVLVADEGLGEVAAGAIGELLVAGPQVARGYWRDPARTAEAFVIPPRHRQIHYRTGDRVRRPADPGGPLSYLGRADHQIKVHGIRIELGEVEAAIRRESGSESVACVGWPRTATGADGIEAFVGGADGVDADRLRARLLDSLPRHMVPRRLHMLDELPLNANGKVDRRLLVATLDGESG